MADWIREANRAAGPVGDSHLREMLGVLGLENLLEAGEGAPAEVVELAERRATARASRDFAESDRLRDELRGARLGGPRRPRGARARPDRPVNAAARSRVVATTRA